jgi:hypothetical protein
MKGESIKNTLIFFDFISRVITHNSLLGLSPSIRKLCQMAGWEEELNQIYSDI